MKKMSRGLRGLRGFEPKSELIWPNLCNPRNPRLTLNKQNAAYRQKAAVATEPGFPGVGGYEQVSGLVGDCNHRSTCGDAAGIGDAFEREPPDGVSVDPSPLSLQLAASRLGNVIGASSFSLQPRLDVCVCGIDQGAQSCDVEVGARF
jgi:hypothetical protein